MWRKRMQDLSRGAGLPHPPLFAPLLFGVAAAIEGLAPEAMVEDGTRLRKNVGELRRMLGTDALYCSAPSAAEAAFVRAAREGDATAALQAQPRLAASLEAVRQWQADTSEPVIVAALSGPATIARALRHEGVELDAETLFEQVGTALAGLARVFCEEGVHVLQWHESVLPDEDELDHWKGALGTAGNVARFHRAVPLLVAPTWSAGWPSQAVAAPTHAQSPGALPRPHGRAWDRDPAHWPTLQAEAGSERLVTTAAEVPADIDIAALLAAVRRVRGQ
jgi:hypothetical protein